ncbi:trans-feruloyl-CoA hydratase/vanillin synthase [Novosphingobium capsulatum]|uniref:Trans-feruloyl-CoA hydratase/vanillin synthase n=1 Tax=Novosphingobium capsulatum TaxID=13688 RepID=A0ABU1MH12_9SPHN|nr:MULTISPECIES: p-hydroxycinnamoyl CoA hydratase/lyase [Novosphingobium]MDR6509312.1 trans-feruloyl-CoA hydratase/vanillin synthase [Novosphingobium capsulatum]PTR12843.1 trans-feruloyl-CoA hydratase/vanillin synthase [Novosphingobium sp. GV055]PUB06627.1 trans-feruloyl-CoA hydratase/vanillin synthase [Novosphingobium sp. GV061]PUB22678.1 trans-feruloyl-CoA hydratase/vanillin synthase [Novosphingobium sp. GV079]PUB44703.1 trans-feruloyl-CoA hydratase/vanillin synthase [Novosphingobium sp. GV0
MADEQAVRAEEDTVAVTIENRIAWVRFNRPEKRNCMSPKLNRQMLKVIEELEFRDDVGVLVLSGEGDAWSAGMDLKEYFRETEAQGLWAIRKSQREAYRWWNRLRWYEKPTIAMVNGWCFGGGYGPLYACDIAVASDDAQFGLSEINWGILPGGGASKVAADLMPLRKAIYHAMMGENLTGPQAAAQGLVTESVPHAQLKARVTEIAEALLKKDGHALRATKWAVRRMIDMTYENAEDYLIRAQEALHSYGGVAARKEATRQFLDEKSFKPGLGTFDTSKVKD